MAWLAHHAEFASGVFVENYGELDLVFEVLLDGFDDGYFASKGEVHDVGGFLRPEAGAIADAEFDAEDQN